MILYIEIDLFFLSKLYWIGNLDILEYYSVFFYAGNCGNWNRIAKNIFNLLN